MTKVKILKQRKFDYSKNPTSYDIILRYNGKKVKGSLTIDSVKKEVEVNLPKRLIHFERLAVLKEIFYVFCQQERKLKGISQENDVKVFRFVEKNSDRKYDTVVKELFSYGKVYFNPKNQKECLMVNIATSIELITASQTSNSAYVGVQEIIAMTSREQEIYVDAIKKYFYEES